MPSEAVRNQCLFLGALGRTSSTQEGGFTGLEFSGSLDIAGRMGLAGRLHWVVHNKVFGVSLAGRPTQNNLVVHHFKFIFLSS